MTLHVVRCDEVAPQPWKNGGGVTRELLAWPARQPGAASAAPAPKDDWALRLSVADITADGPFSAYPGVDRWFAVLQGEGVRLQLATGAREVRAGQAPLTFGGEDAPGCTLLHGATRDLNLRLRRGAGQGAMRLARTAEDFAPRTGLRALFAVVALRLRAGAKAFDLPAFALAWSDDSANESWCLDGMGAPAPLAYWMHFDPGAA